MINDEIDIVVRGTDDLFTSTYVVFDLETTGFNMGDSIIEIGAVKI